MEDYNAFNSTDKFQEADVNKFIKQSDSTGERRFLLELCKTYHVVKIDKVMQIGDWIKMISICLYHIKDNSFGLDERLILITNEMFSRNLECSIIAIVYQSFLDHINFITIEELNCQKNDIKMSIATEMKRLALTVDHNSDKDCKLNKKKTSRGLSASNSEKNELYLDPLPPSTNQADFGGVEFAASILPYKPRYIRELCRENRIPFEKPMGKYIFSRKSLEEWASTSGSKRKKDKLRIGRHV